MASDSKGNAGSGTGGNQTRKSTFDQGLSQLLTTPIHSCLTHFIEEPFENGNRNAMLPCQSTSKHKAAEKSRRRMKEKLDTLIDVLQHPKRQPGRVNTAKSNEDAKSVHLAD
ncbi:hypothetical protein GGR52DRAFT_553760 [Hypoxylon sp. FL1284]|nr:hypothetical protein GGR52DRAFT_553760 [Hypoxylon sp. FL1284]